MIGMTGVLAVCSEIHVPSARLSLTGQIATMKRGGPFRQVAAEKNPAAWSLCKESQPFLNTKRRMATLRTSPIMQKLTTDALPP